MAAPSIRGAIIFSQASSYILAMPTKNPPAFSYHLEATPWNEANGIPWPEKSTRDLIAALAVRLRRGHRKLSPVLREHGAGENAGAWARRVKRPTFP